MQQLLMGNRPPEMYDTSFDLPRLPGVPRRSEPSPKPLWLTATEAELLVSLCFASPTDGGNDEVEFFAKLGRFVKSFSL